MSTAAGTATSAHPSNLTAADSIVTAHEAFLAAVDETPMTRAGWLDAIALALERNAHELVALAHDETHLTLPRLTGELKRTVFQLRLLGQEITSGVHLDATIDHKDDAWGMGPRPDIRRVNVPLGVVGVFGASNFPFAFSVIGGDSASALAAGCAVVHKIHEAHSTLGLRTAAIVVGALDEAGAPSGLFSAVTGRSGGETLVAHPLVKAIGFTGSTAGGRALLERVAQRPEPIPFYGELGSINPVFVTERAWDERSDAILAGYAASFTVGMGQLCTKPGVLLVPTGTLDDTANRLRTALATTLSAPLLSPRLRDGFDQALLSLRRTDGVHDLVPGDEADEPRPTVLATTVAAVRANPQVLNTEMFGPASVIVEYEPGTRLDELVPLFDGQLTTTVHAEPNENVSRLVAALTARSGRVIWNAWPTGVTVSYAQNHGGPYPATTVSATSVGTASIGRFMRAVAYDSFPPGQLPAPLQDANPWHITRRVNGLPEAVSNRGAAHVER